jgi:hypothetical protein
MEKGNEMSDDDLVKRLREVAGFIRFETGDRVPAAGSLSEEAADRIEALQAQLAEVDAELRKARAAICHEKEMQTLVDVLVEAVKRYDAANDSDDAMREWRAVQLAIRAVLAAMEGRRDE